MVGAGLYVTGTASASPEFGMYAGNALMSAFAASALAAAVLSFLRASAGATVVFSS